LERQPVRAEAFGATAQICVSDTCHTGTGGVSNRECPGENGPAGRLQARHRHRACRQRPTLLNVPGGRYPVNAESYADGRDVSRGADCQSSRVLSSLRKIGIRDRLYDAQDPPRSPACQSTPSGPTSPLVPNAIGGGQRHPPQEPGGRPI